MHDFIQKVLSGDNVGAKTLLGDRLREIVAERLDMIKFRVACEMVSEESEEELLDEAGNRNVIKQGRSKIMRMRIRGGKIQRRKRLSNVKGYTWRGGKMIRMSNTERRNRKMAARKGKFKRRAKLSQSLRKRKRSMMKRKSMGG